MAEYLKRGKSVEDVVADDKQTRDIVEGIYLMSKHAVMRRCAICPSSLTTKHRSVLP